MIKIEGGGGQVLRTSLALSCLTGKPFDITGIRKDRRQPGIRNQHLACINVMKDMFSAKTEGAYLGSDSLRFIPGQLRKKNFTVDIGTAGSVTLLLQAILPAVLDKKVNIVARGGTDVKWSMPVDYFSEVILPHYNVYADIGFKLIKRGYYPKGGGEVKLSVRPKEEDKPIDLSERGDLIQIKGVSHSSSDLDDVAERQSQSARHHLSRYDCPVTIYTRYSSTLSSGSGITVWAVFSRKKDEVDFRNPVRLGGDSLGEKGKDAYLIGQEAAKKLSDLISTGAAADEHLADNLIPLLALYGGNISTSRKTEHIMSNMEVCSKFMDVEFQSSASSMEFCISRIS